MVASDLSVKDGRIEGFWIMYYKKWEYNTSYVAEAIVLLELLEVLERKGKHIKEELVIVTFDDRYVH